MTSATDPKTIILAGHCLHKEAIAGATITPGMLVERNASENLIPHGTSGGSAQPAFAIENDLVGRGIDDDYASDDQVMYKVVYEGGEVYALIADGEDIDYDDPLTSDGAGALREAAAGEPVVARSRNSANVAPSGTTARCVVEVATGAQLTT